jgi:type II secretory pathway pseudopilin PulG
MLVLFIIVTLSAISIPVLLRSKKDANAVAAQATLRAISTAAEMYSSVYNGTYPSSIEQLTDPNSLGGRRYLNENYCDGGERFGYKFSCNFGNGYTVYARPINCVTSGDRSFTVTAGGEITQDAQCQEAE